MGGNADPKSGKIIWDAKVPLERQVAFYRAHPPSVLAGPAITCAAIDLSDFKFDGHGEPVNSIFELACSCGNKTFTVQGLVENGEALSPIELDCHGCEALHVVFDARKHGYDGALGHTGNDADEVDWDAIEELQIEGIDAPYQVIVRLEYPSDVLGDEQWKSREHDLFSWITILARDPASGEVGLLFDHECA